MTMTNGYKHITAYVNNVGVNYSDYPGLEASGSKLHAFTQEIFEGLALMGFCLDTKYEGQCYNYVRNTNSEEAYKESIEKIKRVLYKYLEREEREDA